MCELYYTDTSIHPRPFRARRDDLPANRRPQSMVRVDGREFRVEPDDRGREAAGSAGRERIDDELEGRLHDVTIQKHAWDA